MLTEILYGLAYLVLFVLGLTIIVMIIIFRRQLIAFFRMMASPRWNNWIFLGLLALTTFLFFNALYQGGGKPLGLRALQDVGKSTQEDPIAKFYSNSTKNFLPGTLEPLRPPVIPEDRTWIWWKLFLGSLIAMIIYFPIAFWDEIVGAYHRAQEILKQRTRIIDLRPAPQPVPQPGAPQPQPTPQQQPITHASIWTRFKERFWASFSADMISETIFELGSRLFRQMTTRRR